MPTTGAGQRAAWKAHYKGDEWVFESGGSATFLSGSNLWIRSGATLNIQGSISRTSQQYIFNTGAKVGATAGWTVGAADDLGLLATCPASQTAATLVVPLPGLKVGWIITAFSVVGQIESAGNTVTLDANLRSLTAAASDVTDASVGSITQISETSDAIVSASKSGLTETIAADKTYYILLTATTAASTDIALQGVTVTVTET